MARFRILTLPSTGDKHIIDLDRLVYGFTDDYCDSKIMIGSPHFTRSTKMEYDGSVYLMGLNSWFPTFDVNAIPDVKLKDEILKRAMSFKAYATDYRLIDKYFHLRHIRCIGGDDSYLNACDRYLTDSDAPIVLRIKILSHIDSVYDGKEFKMVYRDDEWWNLVIPKEAIMFIDDLYNVCTINGIISGFDGIQKMKMDIIKKTIKKTP